MTGGGGGEFEGREYPGYEVAVMASINQLKFFVLMNFTFCVFLVVSRTPLIL